MPTRRAIVIAVVLTVTPVTAAGVYAQSEPAAESAAVRRPFRGIFGAPSGSDSPHSLVLTGSVFAAYDDNVTEALTAGSVRTPWLLKSGTYQGASAGLNYAFTMDGERVDFRGHAGAQMHYFRHEDRSDTLPSTQADLVFGTRLTKSLKLSARQSVSYSSNYNAALTSWFNNDAGQDIAMPNDVDLDLFALRALRSATRLSLTQSFGRHTSLAAAYHFRSTDILESETPDSRFRDYRTHAGSLGLLYARPLSGHATLNLGYGIRVSDRRSGNGEPEVMHNVTAGVDYGRALSFSRRTSLRFGSGSAIAVSERVDGPAGAADSGRRVRARLTGHAALVHELGRTWTADLAYTRGFQARDGFEQLYFTDAVTATIGGLVTRRLSFSASARWAESSLESGGANGHRGRSAGAQATYALTRFLAFYTRYVYHHYRFDDDIPLDERFPRQLDRHGVRVGLTTSVPLIR